MADQERRDKRWRPDKDTTRLAGVLAAGICLLLVWPYLVSDRNEPSPEDLCKANLKQIAIALLNYHSVHNAYPPAYVADSKGRPMHSWRVLLLPYLNQNSLYERYDFTEPWNGPNNSGLAEQFPQLSVYSCPDDSSKADTSYLVVVGKETMWPGGVGFSGEIPDGFENTIILVESADSGIHWMEPRDLSLSSLPQEINPVEGTGISSSHSGGAYVVTADGGLHFLEDDLSAEMLKKLLIRNDGEEIGGDW